LNFVQRLTEGPILGDGAMGTELLNRGKININACLEETNLTSPKMVLGIHLDYIKAGAEIIETNTFGANRFRLGEHGLENEVFEINNKAVEIAKEARRMTGQHIWIAGTVGPSGKTLPPIGTASNNQIRKAFREQIQVLSSSGIDLLILETFTGLREIKEAIASAKSVTDVPIIALLTFTEEATTLEGETPEEVVSALANLGVASIGANCSVGPAPMVKVLEKMATHTTIPLTAMPNAGFPTYVDGRFIYMSSPNYMSQHETTLLKIGVKVVGGCCGTGPKHIFAMREELGKYKLPHPNKISTIRTPLIQNYKQPPLITPTEPTKLSQKIGKEFTITVEVDPPQGFDASNILSDLRSLLRTTEIDAFNVSDNPRARGRMSALAMSTLIQTGLGIEAILHIATRHRNLLALHSDLLGAHGLGIRNVFVIMGDLPYMGEYPQATAVTDVTPSGLISLIDRANTGRNLAGHPIKYATSFLVGCAFNMGAIDLDKEIQNLERKLKAGARFILSQAVFDLKSFEYTYEKLGGFPVPLLMGLLPLNNIRHAEFLHNEVPGITIPEEIMFRMRSADQKGQLEGIAIAQELLQEAYPKIAGVYFIPSFGKYQTVAQILNGIPDLNKHNSRSI